MVVWPWTIRKHTLESVTIREELGVCGSLKIMFQAIRRWSSLGAYNTGAWPDISTSEGIGVCLMTCIIPISVHELNC
jgi:hypothetical protein